MEQWKVVPGWLNYSVSDLGKVHGPRKILKPEMVKGYPRVNFYRAGRWTHFQAHQLVMLAFVGPPPEGHHVHHKNKDRADNRLENLEYVKQSEHLARYHSGSHLNVGSKHAMHKLVEADIIAIRKQHAELGSTATSIAKAYGMCVGSISLILNRRTWTHV